MDTTTPDAPSLAGKSREIYAKGRQMMLLFDLDGYAEAVPLFLEAIEADCSNALAHAALAETYAFWGFRRELIGLESQSYYDLSLESAAEALRLVPELSEAHRAMAVALRKGEQSDPAARRNHAKTAMDINPYNGENCHEFWKAFGSDLADRSIHKAIALCPSLASAHIDLGVALCDRGRLEESAYHLGCALEINPRNSLAHYNLAMVRLRQGLGTQALELLNRGLAHHPGDPLLQEGLAIVAAETGRKAP